MRAIWILGFSFLAGFVLSEVAEAQNGPVTTPVQNWTFYRHASTETEGFLRGQADYVQSVGQADYYRSLAAVNYQDAYRRSLENARLYTQVYLERKEMMKQYQERYREKPPTKEQVQHLTAISRPTRLDNDEYDRVTGKLSWPHILRQSKYDALREQIDVLMASRNETNSGDGSVTHTEISQLVDATRRLLKDNFENVTRQQFGMAMVFLNALEYESQLRVVKAAPKT